MSHDMTEHPSLTKVPNTKRFMIQPYQFRSHSVLYWSLSSSTTGVVTTGVVTTGVVTTGVVTTGVVTTGVVKTGVVLIMYEREIVSFGFAVAKVGLTSKAELFGGQSSVSLNFARTQTSSSTVVGFSEGSKDQRAFI
jgi:hypothetical protein